jgi:hypothetical protein
MLWAGRLDTQTSIPPKDVVVRFQVPHGAVFEDANLQRRGAVLLGEWLLRFPRVTGAFNCKRQAVTEEWESFEVFNFMNSHIIKHIFIQTHQMHDVYS